MQISISGIFNTPKYQFDLSATFLAMLINQISENILSKYTLKKVRAKELEIYLCTDGTDSESSVKKISKNDNGKYLTFHFWIAYPKVVRSVTEKLFTDMDLTAFVSEFMFCLKESLMPYDIPEMAFDETEKKILEILETDLSKYTFELSDEEAKLRLALRGILEKKGTM
jgi:hypothetical protein